MALFLFRARGFGLVAARPREANVSAVAFAEPNDQRWLDSEPHLARSPRAVAAAAGGIGESSDSCSHILSGEATPKGTDS